MNLDELKEANNAGNSKRAVEISNAVDTEILEELRKMHPYHIIEVECPECEKTPHSYKNFYGKNPFHHTSCNNTGRRRMAVWQLRKQPDKIFNPKRSLSCSDERVVIHYNNEVYSVYGFIEEQSPYQSGDTLESGEKIGKVELKQSKTIMVTPYELKCIYEKWPDLQDDTWLCTALIKEKE